MLMLTRAAGVSSRLAPRAMAPTMCAAPALAPRTMMMTMSTRTATTPPLRARLPPSSALAAAGPTLLAKRFASSTPAGAAPAPATSFLYRHRIVRWVLWGTFSIVFGITATVAIILGHDALTYRNPHVGDVPCSKLALHPEPGGPKKLPIISEFVEEGEEDDFTRECKGKERLVIVGGGWAAVGLLGKLDPGKYNVTLVSPSNFYLFTPLLPSATVGTVEPRSLIEPIRKVLSRHRGHYVQGKAVDVEFDETTGPDGKKQRLLEVQLVSGEDRNAASGRSHPEAGGDSPTRPEVEGKRVYIPYDKLVVAVGSVTSTHGVPGLENAFHLKEIDDARGIRSRILDNLEIASLPTTTPEERKRLLSFVISGGGPTGVETAAEIYDMLNEDVLDYFPKLLRSQARVSLIQSRGHILNTYSEKISKYAEEKFARDEVNVVVNARVKEVKPDSVTYTVKHPETGKVEEHEIPSGMTLWSTGIAMSPFTRALVNKLPNQSHLKALLVDAHLRVQGTPQGSVYALGDASTINSRLIDSLYEFVDDVDTRHTGKLTFEEFSTLAQRVRKRYPLSSKHFEKLRDLFETYDVDHDGTLSVNEIANMFLAIQSKVTSLPATAQVASQEGKYLAAKLNKLAKMRSEGKLIPKDVADDPAMSIEFDVDDAHYKTFSYKSLGSLAFLGNAAAVDGLPYLPESLSSLAGGLVAMYAWRSVYLSEQCSMRTRMLLMSDWVKRGIWGRDLSRL